MPHNIAIVVLFALLTTNCGGGDAIYPRPNVLTTSSWLPNSEEIEGTLSAVQASKFYRVTLNANQAIFLQVNPPQADLDLYVYDEAGVVQAFSLGDEMIEKITVAQSGSYIIEVRAISGSAASYRLSQFQPEHGAVTALSSDTRFAPGELIVHFAKGATLNTKSAVQKYNNLGLSLEAGEATRGAFMRITTTVADSPLHFADASLQAKYTTLLHAKTLRARDDIKSADPNVLLQPLVTPNDPSYSAQWQYPLIRLPQAWDIVAGAADVVVAIVDTGVALAHPDLSGQITPGYDFIRDPENANDGDGIDNNPDDPGDKNPRGSTYHGTHVAGIIAAATNNQQGVSGVAWLAQLMPLRVSGKQGATLYDLQQALRYASGLPNDSQATPQKKADVINISLGTPSHVPSLQLTLDEVRIAGVIVVAAAGNEGSTTPIYPAAYASVIAVSAIDSAKQVTPYSSYGSYIDVSAPGGNLSQDSNFDGLRDGILSTGVTEILDTVQFNYLMLQGTSMASPHVAGIAALMKTLNSDMTPTQFADWLSQGKLTQDAGLPGWDPYYGEGIIDAYAAVSVAMNAKRFNDNASSN